MLVTPLLLALLAADHDTPKAIYKPELFQTLIDPDCSHCRDEARRAAGSLRDDDRVLAWTRGDYTGGAIPYRWFLVPYRVISDTYGVFVYDADADFVRGWPASLDFRFHGWRNGVMVMKRSKDGTIFDCLTGLAVEGPAKGEGLKAVPTIESDWGAWSREHPGTVAYQMIAKYAPMPIPREVRPESKQTRPAPDPRLDPEARVFGLSLGKESAAWPLSGFGDKPELRQVTVGGEKVLILWNPSTKAAAAYAPETEGKSPEPVSLKLDASDPDAPWLDETGSRWSIVGRAVSGPRQGQTLRWLPGVMVKWYAWAASYPETKLGSSAQAR